jgi:hypothetical protein
MNEGVGAVQNRPVAGIDDVVAGASVESDQLHVVGFDDVISRSRIHHECRGKAYTELDALHLTRRIDDQRVIALTAVDDIDAASHCSGASEGIDQIVNRNSGGLADLSD